MGEQNGRTSRRLSSRIKTSEGVWVIWSCGGRDETSRVANLSPGGLFIETQTPRPIGAEAHLEFLVEEGQIRAKAVVQHVEPGRGLGLKLTALSKDDGCHLVGLIKRLRGSSRQN